MVQLEYYERRGESCREALRREGHSNTVLLFPYEGWARPASITYLTLKLPWWSRTRCKVVEVRGARKMTGRGRIVDGGKGRMYICGRFKPPTGRTHGQLDFRLSLSTDVSNADFHLGYSVTGMMERGNRKTGELEMTHFAMIKRNGY